MAMVASDMADRIVDKLKVLNTDIDGDIETDLREFWTEICEGILDEFSANSQVAPNTFNVTGTPVTGIGGPVT